MMGFFFFHRAIRAVYGWTPLQAGLAFLPMTLSQLRRRRPGAPSARAGPAGRWCSRGVVLTAAGMVWLSRLALHALRHRRGAALILIGAGQGLARPHATSSGVDGVASGDAGAASGLVITVHQIGSALSL